ncbi:hypothetical protein HMPREF1631_06885 [Arcanobacterium sp. S3PF19]|nr:hypothetical protein HMPREF1631_06885 [Arcanobacterium sp. S3PF19]
MPGMPPHFSVRAALSGCRRQDVSMVKTTPFSFVGRILIRYIGKQLKTNAALIRLSPGSLRKNAAGIRRQ